MSLTRRRRLAALTLTCLGMATVAAAAVGVAMPWGEDEAPKAEANLTSLEMRASELRSVTISFTERCMRDTGFSAYSEAYASSRQSDVRWIERGMVYWHPLESGPIDEAHATMLGLLGTSLIFQEPVPAAVTGDNREYMRALDRCDLRLDERAGEDVRSLLDDWSLLWARVRRHFTELATAEAGTVLGELYDCWLPRIGFDPKDGRRMDSYTTLLRDLKIEEGQYVIPQGSADEVALGGGLVLVPRPRAEYRPTPAEAAVAIEFARCAESTRFAERLDKAQRGPAEGTLRAFDDELDQIGERIDQALAADLAS